MALTTTAEVIKMLRWGTAEQTKYESHLDDYIDAASQVIENMAGPFEARTVQHITDGAPSLTLPTRVNAVTTIEVDTGSTGYGWVDGYYVPDGSTWAEFAGEFTVNLAAGIVHGAFPRGRQNVRVTYTTGYDTLPPAAVFAATSLVCHMWAVASQRGPGLPEDYTAVPTGFLVPNVVKEALAPFKTMPGFA